MFAVSSGVFSLTIGVHVGIRGEVYRNQYEIFRIFIFAPAHVVDHVYDLPHWF